MSQFNIPAPSIHMNGTSAQTLFGNARAVVNALDAAIKAVSEACPHGRDYYPQGADALGYAYSAHLDRRQVLEAMRSAYVDHALALYDQIDPAKVNTSS